MAKGENLRKRLTRYIEVIEGEVGRGDPLDSQFFKGYDQALGNVAWSLKRILAEETNE